MRLKVIPRASRPIEPIGMINVIFLLLIFFLVAGSFAPRPPDFLQLARLPADGSDPAVAALEAIALDADGVWHVGADPVAAADLAARLAGRDDGQPLTLYVDRTLAAGRLAEGLDALAAAGIEQLRVVTLSGGGE